MSKLNLFIFLAISSLHSCSSGPTPYQPADEDGFGYKESEIGPGKFLVQFKGSKQTDFFTAKTHAIRRANELCQSKGMKEAVIESTDNASTSGVTPSNMRCHQGGSCVDIGSRSYTRPVAVLTIKCKQ